MVVFCLEGHLKTTKLFKYYIILVPSSETAPLLHLFFLFRIVSDKTKKIDRTVLCRLNDSISQNRKLS